MNRLARTAITLLACVALGTVAFGAGGKGGAEKDTASLKGKPAPDFTLPVLGGGTEVKLSALKGDVVLLDYWATWCPPCRASLPHINDLANDAALAKQGLKVFAVNSKEADDLAQKFVAKNNYTFTVPMDHEGTFGKEYLVRGIPTTVIVGRDGKIADVFIGFGPGQEKKIHSAVEKALKAPRPGGNVG